MNMTAKLKRAATRGSLLFGAAALLTVGFYLGHSTGETPLGAQAAAQQPNTAPVVPVNGAIPSVDPTKRVIAYVYGNVPITREEFGDYLIWLYADERLPLYVNRRIIEMAAARQQIDVTPQEIEATIEEDCRVMNISKSDYDKRILKERYNKTPDEWRIDAIKPRLLLAKMCRGRITADELELKQMFENFYGEKAVCKIIVWPKDQRRIAEKQYGELRQPGTAANPDAGWDSVATKQADPKLAANAGLVDPIGRYSGAESSKIEDIAFTLKVGEVSPIVETSVGFIVVKRVGTVEPVKGVEFEKTKPDLYKKVIDRKLAKEVPVFFAEMRKKADPLLLAGKHAHSVSDQTLMPAEIK
jgi:PPIC-type PPIASE domain